MTRNVGRSKGKENHAPIDRKSLKRVLICRPNHRLGNQIMISPLLEEVSKTFPNCKIDLFTKGGLAPILFMNFEQTNCFIRLPKKHFHQLPQYIYAWFSLKKRHYDLVVNADKNSSSGRLSTRFARSSHKFFGDIDEVFTEHPDAIHFAKGPVYGLRHYLSKCGIPETDKPVPTLDLKLSEEEIKKGREVLKKHMGNDKPTICLYTYATDDKCFSKSWWKEFYGILKSRFENHNIFEVLPVENVSQIDFAAPAYYSKDIREICAVIDNCTVFIGADCGVMHLATASGTPTIGLFSRNNVEKYKPYGGMNTAFYTGETEMDEIVGTVEEILP